MRSPLSAALSDPGRPVPSYWAETAPIERPGAPLEGEREVEVAIIGGGYTGLSCALTLARDYGVQAAVLEAGEIGWGASGRNGGMACIDCTQLSLAEKRRRVGEEEVLRYYASQAEAVVNLRALIAEEGVACDAAGSAVLEIASSPKSFAAMEGDVALFAGKLGLRARRVAPEELRESAFDSPRAHGALELGPGFGLHPLKLALGLAEAAERRGAALYPKSPVTGWRREQGRHLLETPRGAVRARFVALATNGFTPDGLHPGFTGRAVPALSNIAVTRPLSDDELDAQRWREMRPMYDDRHLLHYFRMLPDRRFLLGARGDIWGTEKGAERMKARLRRDLAALFPAWADVPFTHFWRGPICATLARAPSLGRLPDDPTVLHSFAYHGNGVNSATWCGAALARMIGEGDAALEGVPLLYRGRAPRVPIPGLRPLLVGAAFMWRGFRDKTGL